MKNALKLLRNVKGWQCYNTHTANVEERMRKKNLFPLRVIIDMPLEMLPENNSVLRRVPVGARSPPSHTRLGCVQPVLGGSCPLW